MSRKIAFHTLGCKLNFSETSTIAREFSEKGYDRVKFGEDADIVVLNTCSVTQIAEKKCLQAIRKAKAKSPDAIIAVTGCFAQLDAETISKIEGVDIVLGTNDKFNLLSILENYAGRDNSAVHSCEISEVTAFDKAYTTSDRTRTFVKVQDGCDYPCTYCTIPKARGKSRNPKIEEIINDVEKIVIGGAKEIILTGVNIGDFGRSTGENFFDLIKSLDNVSGLERIRISSIEPNLLKDEIIEFCSKSKKIMPHFHIPLQSGSDEILALMKRRYNTGLFAEKINKIREFQPEAFIGIDVIVGFPGETEEHFKQTFSFLEKSDISFIHVFSYSERKATPASEMQNKISPKLIKQRSDILHELSAKKHEIFCKRNFGKTSKVLFEEKEKSDFIFGFTENYIKVKTTFNKLYINQIKEVKISEYIKEEELCCILFEL